MKRQNLFALSTLLMTALFISFGGWAQEIAATLSGTVTDPTGAVIQAATVVIHNDGTNTDVRTVKTDSSGNYTATNLQAGTYTVAVKAPGFKTYTGQNVILNVAQKRTLNAQMQTGQISESITVQETTAPIQTSSAAQSGTVSGTQVRELELNNRNFEQLVTLQPGVTSGLPAVVGFGISNTSSVVVNGARDSANNWTVDGADINDSGSNLTLLNVPSVDAIQEFTLQRSTYDAQYGRSGGGQVLVATKSGTNDFHGDAYEFVRNDFFNANDFFANSTGTPRSPERYNDFGFTFGGPLFIPKLYPRSKSKTYFFWSEEWRKTTQPGTDVATVPTASELTGSFPGVALNPSAAPAGCITNTGSGGQISPSCVSQNAKVYLANIYSKFPANAAGGSQYITNTTALNNYRQDVVRLDQNITDKIHIFGRYMQDSVPTTEPGGLFASEPFPGISSTATNAPGKNVVANMTWTISPSIVNEAAFNYTWGAINSNITGTVDSPAFVNALAGGLPYSDPYGRVPGFTISGLTGLALPTAPYFERNIDKNPYDNLSLVRGNHTIRLGITAQWMTKTENAVNPTNGSFEFRNANGNPAFANFLLGDASLFSQDNRDIIPHLNYYNLEAYVQDDWKVAPNFTLNVGLRYSYFPSPTDSNHVLNNFDPSLFNPSAVPAIDPTTGLFLPGQSVVPATYVNGIIFPSNSCAAAQKVAAVTCSPYGNLVNPNSNKNFAPRFGFAWDPTKDGKTAIRGGYGIFYDRSLNGIWEQNAFSDPPLVQTAQIANTSFDHPLAGSVSTPLGPVGINATGNPTFQVPYYQDWNFSIQREILRNTELQVAYVGGKGTHLLGEVDANQPSLAVRDANPASDVDAIRPYLGYAAFYQRDPMFNSNYNSLQVSLNRHVAPGLTFGVAYTWSRNLTDNTADREAPIYDSYNAGLDYGPAYINTPQIFIVNYVYDLPFFKGQKGFAGKVLGGWEVSGITTVQTGQSYSITQSEDPFNSNDFPGVPGTYPGGIGIDENSFLAPRADLVAGTSLSGPGTVAEYFNTKAFTDAIGHFGTAGPGLLLGPGLQNWDIAGIKNFQIGERFRLQFRGEFFNAFNHVNFTTVDANVDDATFGRLTGDRTPRNIQLGLKLYF